MNEQEILARKYLQKQVQRRECDNQQINLNLYVYYQ